MVGNQLLVKMNLSDHLLNNSRARSLRPSVGISEKTLQLNKLYENEPPLQHYQQRFSNMSYISNNCLRQQYTILSSTVTSHNSQQSK